jgi:Protein of unknown function (DUF2974)
MDRDKSSFNAQVKARDGIAKYDLDMAEIANAVYLDDHSRVNQRWRRLGDEELPKNIDSKSLVDDKTLFRAGVYTNDKDQFVVAYRGSYTKKFGALPYVPVNVGQAMGASTKQYEQASRLAKQAQEAYGDKVVFTGHSLGGGLAAAASMRTGNAAVTFNPAGLSEATYYANSMLPDIGKKRAEDGMIRKYQLEGEFLQVIEHSGVAPRAPGKETVLNHPTATGAKELHKMDRLISAMELDPGARFVDGEKYKEIAEIWKAPNVERSDSQKRIAGLIDDAVEKGLAKHGNAAGSKREISDYIRDKAFAALSRDEAMRPHGVGHRQHIKTMQNAGRTGTDPLSRTKTSDVRSPERPQSARGRNEADSRSPSPIDSRPPPALSKLTTLDRTRTKSPERGDR